jgi:septal ring factor EnvC (AmiA/AmiB activator)
VVSNFRSGSTRIDGIRIASSFGAPVKAAAAGEVVYAGNEVPGYGQLVLVRHSSNWVTAYALNSNLRVSKNDRVEAGQHIADVGRASADGDSLLHFEIRRGVSPVNPIEHLPQRRTAS